MLPLKLDLLLCFYGYKQLKIFIRSGLTKEKEMLLFFSLLFITFCFVMVRGFGVLPSVMADEWHYSLMSRLLPFSQSDDPGYVYLGLYSLTKYSNDGYYCFVRFLNAIFYVCGCLFVFLTSRRILSFKRSLIVLSLMVLAPESVYSLFFMPESMYFCIFWFFAWVALSPREHSLLRSVKCGAILSVLSLIKPHAIFMVPCFCLFVFLSKAGENENNLLCKLRLVISFLFVFFLVKFLLGFMFAGSHGITLLGNRYSDMASNNISFVKLFDLFIITSRILINHISMMSLLYFVPLVGAVSILFKSCNTLNESEIRIRNMVVFFLVVFVPMLFVTSSFSASVAGTNPYDIIERMHLRYYNFMLPMLLILCAAFAFEFKHDIDNKYVLTFFVICFVLGVFRVLFAKSGIVVNWIDSPELVFLNGSMILCYLTVLVACLVVFYAFFSIKKSALCCLVVLLPLVFVSNLLSVEHDISARKTPDEYDSAGIALRGLISKSKQEQVTLFGPDEAFLYRTSFYLDKPNTAIRVVNNTYNISSIPNEATFVVVFGSAEFTGPDFQLIATNGFRLYKRVNYIQGV